ncbi:MAG: hypothetical protein Q9174_005010 [Haloplaca sp. 1 TL-2023]
MPPSSTHIPNSNPNISPNTPPSTKAMTNVSPFIPSTLSAAAKQLFEDGKAHKIKAAMEEYEDDVEAATQVYEARIQAANDAAMQRYETFIEALTLRVIMDEWDVASFFSNLRMGRF